MSNEEKSKIEELKKALYSRGATDIKSRHHNKFHQKDFEVKTDWAEPEQILNDPAVEQVKLNSYYQNTSMSFFKKLLIGSVIFFLIALGIGGYVVLRGGNIVSANNVDIQVTGPVSVAGGEPVSLNVQVLNKNNIKLQLVDLSIDFPDGTANPDNVSQEMKTFRELMDDIEPGGISQKTIRAALFGEENSKKIIKVNVEYRVAGSNALFHKDKDYEILISSSPISLSVSSFSEVTSGQEFEVTAVMTSNSKTVLKDLVLKGAYPVGFTYISSDMKPVGDNMTWKIGDLPPKSKKTIVIKGKLEGQDEEDRVFRFIVGAASAKNDKIIGTQYVASTQDVKIQKPFISVGVSLEGDDLNQEYTGQFNNPIQAEVTWFNNLDTAVIDGEIHVKLSGTAFDKVAVSPQQGYYQSANNEIVWNKITTKELASIGAGESGRVSFSITPKDLSSGGRSIINPDLGIDVSVKGSRISESNVPEAVVSSATRHVRVASNATLSGQIVRTTGAFTNTGPFPPLAEKQTSYTVVWTVYNTSSNISDARVVATLPPYVKWASKISPTSEDIKYNSVNGQITWNIGSVGAYTGSGASKKEVSFQIILEPSVTQVGQSLQLVNDATLTATDEFTGVSLKSVQSGQGTRLDTDPAFKNGDEIVGR